MRAIVTLRQSGWPAGQVVLELAVEGKPTELQTHTVTNVRSLKLYSDPRGGKS